MRFISFVQLELIIMDKFVTKQNAPSTSGEPAKKKKTRASGHTRILQWLFEVGLSHWIISYNVLFAFKFYFKKV